MNDFPTTPDSGTLASGRSLSVAGAWPAVARSHARHTLVRGVFRPQQELSVYCNPIALFFAVWVLMLACLSVHVSYVIYPYVFTPILIFIVSTGSLYLGFFASTAVLVQDTPRNTSTAYLLDVTLLWRLNLLFCVFALALIGLDWFTSGPPPAISDPSTYLTYGKLKQILFPLLTCIAVNVTLDTSRLRRYMFMAFGLGGLGVYVARGIILVAFLQMLFLFSLRTSMSRRKQYLLFAAALVAAIAATTIIGNLRTAHSIFIEFLQIRDKYSEWPMAFLWLVS